MDTSTRHDILASNLLFATLGVSVLGEVGMLCFKIYEAHRAHVPVTIYTGKLLTILILSVLLRVGLYYAIRRGFLVAKLVFVLGFVGWACAKTNWAAGQVAEVDFTYLWGYPLLVLVRNLLTLAALALMFTKSRVATA